MIAGETNWNGFPENEDHSRRILIRGSRSIGKRRGDGEGLPEIAGCGSMGIGALAERIDVLEKELYDYQYHMGLLLIEKKMRASEFEELRQGLSEARANLKLELATFSSTLSEKQKHEQSILMALEAERHHVAQLENTICKMQEEEKHRSEHRETQQSWKSVLQEHESDLNESQNFLSEGKKNIANEKDESSGIKEAFEETQNRIIREVESKQEKLDKTQRDPLGTQVKLDHRENVLQSKKQVVVLGLESGTESGYVEKKYNLNNLDKLIAVEGESGSKIIDHLLDYKKEIEADKIKIPEDKETLNTLYGKLHKFKQELIKKRELLFSLREHSKTCMNCSMIFSEIDFASLETIGAELADDILLLSIPYGIDLEKPFNGQNDGAYHQCKGCQLVKIGGSMPCLQQCSQSCNFSSRGREPYPVGYGRKVAEIENRHQSISAFSPGQLDKKREEPGNRERKVEITERIPKTVHSSEQCSEIVSDALEIECQPNDSSINEANGSHARSSKGRRGRPRLNKRTCFIKAVVTNAEETMEDIPKEIKRIENHGSEDSNDVNGESKLKLLNAVKMGISSEQPDFCHGSGTTTFESNSYKRKAQLAKNGHHQRQKASDIGLSTPAKKLYNLRPSTILKVLKSLQWSKNAVLKRDSDEMDMDYDPGISD